jgi:RHS repeat-associated protein
VLSLSKYSNITQPTFGSAIESRAFASGGYRYGFNGKENIDEVAGQGNWQDYGERMYNPRLGRFPSPDPIIIYGKQYPELSPYQFASNTPIQAIDLDGLEAYIVVFPDYKISTLLGKIGGLGHAGSLIINPTTGDAYYMEYGRYNSSKGNARALDDIHKIGTVTFGDDGLPKTESLSNVLGVISKKAGHGGRIEAAEFQITQGEFDKMYSDHEKYLNEADDPNRKPYKLQGNDAHNCGTAACGIVGDNLENSDLPEKTNARPVKMIQEVLDKSKKGTRVGYDPNKKTTTRGGSYIPSADEKETDKKVGN